MNKYRIEMTGPIRGRVWIDGIEVTGVKSIVFTAGHEQPAEITLTIHAGEVAISGESEVS